jgi:hypothetical protein
LAAFILLLFGARALLSARSTLLLLGLWVVIPVAGILAADVLNGTKAITVTRYWMVTSPALYLFMAVGAQQLGKRFGELTLISVLTVLLGVAGFYTAAGRLRQKPYDFKGLARQLESHIEDPERDVVLAEGPAAIPLALAYYGRREIQVWRLNLSLGEPSEQEFVAAMRSVAGRRGVVWLVSNQADGAAAALGSAGFRRDDSRGRLGLQNVSRYAVE